MPAADHYLSRSGHAAQAVAESPFTIEVRFTGGLSDRQRAAFASAADRWSQVIVGDLPSVVVDGETIDDVLIVAEGADIDGTGQVLGQAGPTHLRPESAGVAALLPARGEMTFDSADLAALQADGSLDDVIAHEMGHVLGIGTLWEAKGLLAGSGSGDPTFTGAGAVAEWGALGGSGDVPVENTGGPGTAEGHWRESVFADELMSGFISEAGNPLSRMTAASLRDLGYDVALDAAEAYALPAAAPAGRAAAVRRLARCAVTVPTAVVLPGSSLLG
ncbi:leishmanolysin-related zinc metalloendopeptidase [Pseudonocardia sp.]|uniref:leishmanolysin-related zinc metalloendopeptidase n=1 Tax=Pseudonocardia sp. TaxID=60912 RepID=UPI00263917B5|nr:leishmanolysin-related zinc metalloendopeptidase [Pseudonocardia sp.]